MRQALGTRMTNNRQGRAETIPIGGVFIYRILYLPAISILLVIKITDDFQ